LLVVGVWRLAASARRMIAAIAERAPVTILLPTLDPRIDSAHAELRAWASSLGATSETCAADDGSGSLALLRRRLHAPAGPIAGAGAIELLSAPDALTETREAAR